MSELPPAVVGSLEEARSLGFLGPGPLGPHIDHALGFDGAYRRHAGGSPAGPRAAIDLGSGGGLPGLVLASVWPGTRFVLLESGHRRADFLRRVVRMCGFADRTVVLEARAEVAGRDPEQRGAFDVAVARSFGPPPVTAECAAPFLALEGLLVVSEPPHAEAGIDRWPPAGLSELGLEDDGVHRVTYGYRVLRQHRPVGHRYPRRSGVPAKRPLF